MQIFQIQPQGHFSELALNLLKLKREQQFLVAINIILY